MTKKIENLAWFILSLSFIACLIFSAGVPLGTRWFILNNTRTLTILLQLRRGSVTYWAPRSNSPVLLTENAEIRQGSKIVLSNNADVLMLFYLHDEPDTPIITAQLYGRTELTIDYANTPRYRISELPNKVGLTVERASNMQPSVAANSRLTQLKAVTPHGAIDMDEGAFTIVVSPSLTEFSVKSGQASVPDPVSGDNLGLTRLQRIQITSEGLGNLFIGERDILRNRNGSFDEPLEEYWQIYTDKAYAEETDGTVRQTQTAEGVHLILFSRVGKSHAVTGISQQLDEDIRGVDSLKVSMRVRVDTQTLPGCGSLGTECPIMIRLEYLEQETGSLHEWLQGFYAIGIENGDDVFCQPCTWKAQHEQVAGLGVWYDYESPDLLPLLRAQGIEPSSIHLIQIYASGHTYGSAVDDVAILIGE
jgi:hypothetical protein